MASDFFLKMGNLEMRILVCVVALVLIMLTNEVRADCGLSLKAVEDGQTIGHQIYHVRRGVLGIQGRRTMRAVQRIENGRNWQAVTVVPAEAKPSKEVWVQQRRVRSARACAS